MNDYYKRDGKRKVNNHKTLKQLSGVFGVPIKDLIDWKEGKKSLEKGEQMRENEEQRKNLKKYYKVVKDCTLCHKPYGTDRPGDNGICLVCRDDSDERNKHLRRVLKGVRIPKEWVVY